MRMEIGALFEIWRAIRDRAERRAEGSMPANRGGSTYTACLSLRKGDARSVAKGALKSFVWGDDVGGGVGVVEDEIEKLLIRTEVSFETAENGQRVSRTCQTKKLGG